MYEREVINAEMYEEKKKTKQNKLESEKNTVYYVGYPWVTGS